MHSTSRRLASLYSEMEDDWISSTTKRKARKEAKAAVNKSTSHCVCDTELQFNRPSWIARVEPESNAFYRVTHHVVP